MKNSNSTAATFATVTSSFEVSYPQKNEVSKFYRIDGKKEGGKYFLTIFALTDATNMTWEKATGKLKAAAWIEKDLANIMRNDLDKLEMEAVSRIVADIAPVAKPTAAQVVEVAAKTPKMAKAAKEAATAVQIAEKAKAAAKSAKAKKQIIATPEETQTAAVETMLEIASDVAAIEETGVNIAPAEKTAKKPATEKKAPNVAIITPEDFRAAVDAEKAFTKSGHKILSYELKKTQAGNDYYECKLSNGKKSECLLTILARWYKIAE